MLRSSSVPLVSVVCGSSTTTTSAIVANMHAIAAVVDIPPTTRIRDVFVLMVVIVGSPKVKAYALGTEEF